MATLIPAINQGEARLREQAVRILGRDCRENGHVEYQKPEARLEPPRSNISTSLLALADDPDAGVRRELILAFRNLPTEQGRRCPSQAGRVVGRARSLVFGSPRAGAREARERLPFGAFRRHTLR